MTPAERIAATKKPHKAKPLPACPVLVCTIRSVRQSLRLSLRDVAKATNLAIANIHRVERGGDVQLTTARALAKFYGKTLEELWP